MAAEETGKQEATAGAGKAFIALAVIAVLGMVFSWAVSGPSRRKYPERTPVRFWHMWTAEWKVVVEDICDRFNESQDKYEVIPLSVPYQTADSKFLLAVAGGDPPDCMAQWNPVIPKWAESKLLVPLDTLMSEEEWADFKATAYPVARKIGMYKGHLYGVTTGLNIWAMYYRLDHLKEAGLLPPGTPERITSLDDLRGVQVYLPKTLEALDEWGRMLHKYDGDLLSRVGFLPEFLRMYATRFGGGFYDYEAGELTLNTPANLRTLTYLAKCREELGFDKVVRFESSLTTRFGADWPFITGKYSCVSDGQWRVVQLKRFAPELTYVTAPVPTPAEGGRDRAGWSNGNFMIIPAGAKHADGAWEFIKFWSGLAEPERAAEFYTWGGWLPLNTHVAQSPIYRKYVEDHPTFQTFLDILPSPNIEPTPPVPYQVYLQDRIKATYESATLGSLSPEKALERLEHEIAGEIRRRKEFGYED